MPFQSNLFYGMFGQNGLFYGKNQVEEEGNTMDASIIGRAGKPYEVTIEADRIKVFAKALQDANPLFSDDSGGTLYAPPTFPTTFGFPIDLLSELNIDFLRLLHGEQEYIYFKPIKAGDTLVCTSRIADVSEKEGKTGPMKLIVLETEARDKHTNDPVVISKATLVIRG